MKEKRIREVCECLQSQTRQMLKIKPPNPYVTGIEIYKPSDVGKTTFEGFLYLRGDLQSTSKWGVVATSGKVK